MLLNNGIDLGFVCRSPYWLEEWRRSSWVPKMLLTAFTWNAGMMPIGSSQLVVISRQLLAVTEPFSVSYLWRREFAFSWSFELTGTILCVLVCRKGFCRLAIQENAGVVPVYYFNENQVGIPVQLIWTFQVPLQFQISFLHFSMLLTPTICVTADVYAQFQVLLRVLGASE